MEININNAFGEAVKFCLRPCYPVYIAVSDSIQRKMYEIVCHLLQAPLCATLTAYFIIVPLTMLLTFSSLTYIGIICFIISIIMFQDFRFTRENIKLIWTIVTILSSFATRVLSIGLYSRHFNKSLIC